MKQKTTNSVETDRGQCRPERDTTMTKLSPSSPEADTVTEQIRKTNFAEQFTDRYWRTEHIELVKNDRLKRNYDAFKSELKTLGRKAEDLDDVLVFTAETDKSCREISVEGRKVCLRKRHVLGYTGSGVHLVRNFDILSRYMAYQQYTSPAYIMVYKAFLGKAKPIVPRLHKDDNYVSPWCGFDCHISARKIEPDMPICEALNCSYVYFYEYDDISSNTVAFPRQILPHAVLRLTRRHTLCIESPFFAVGRDHTNTPIEVKGETRRGFRFNYPPNFKKLKPQKQNTDKQLFIKNSLKEQLLEMRTKGDTRSNPPLLEKSLIEKSTKQTTGNERLKFLSPPTLLKCDSGTINFKGEKFCVSPSIIDKTMHLNQGDLYAVSDNGKVNKDQEYKDRLNVRRLPLSMKPFVSVKRLQRHSLHRTKTNQDSKQKHTIKDKEKHEVIESNISDLELNQNIELKQRDTEKYEEGLNTTEVPSTQKMKPKTICYENSQENKSHLSEQDDRKENQTSNRHILDVLEKTNNTSNKSIDDCNLRSENKSGAIDNIEMISKVEEIRLNSVTPAMDGINQNTSNHYSCDDSGENNKKKENSSLCSLRKSGQVSDRFEFKVEAAKPKSVDKESKSKRSSNSFYDIHTSGWKVISDKESEKQIRKESFHSVNVKQGNCENSVKSNHNKMELEHNASKRSKEDNSKTATFDFSKKLMPSLQVKEHKEQNTIIDSENTQALQPTIVNPENCPPLPEIRSPLSLPVRHGFESTNFKRKRENSDPFALTTAKKAQKDKLVPEANSICIESNVPETPKDMHAKMEISEPKTIKDLFREPLRNQLFEKMKLNPRLDNVCLSFGLQAFSQTGLTKTASPPAGVVAPVQLDRSPTVASAKISNSPFQSSHAFGSINRILSHNNQRKEHINNVHNIDNMKDNVYYKQNIRSGGTTFSGKDKLYKTSQPHESFSFKIQNCQHQAMDKERILKSSNQDETQIQKKKRKKGRENLSLSTAISHNQQNLPFPVIQGNIGVKMPLSFNIPNLIHDEPSECDDKYFQTPEMGVSCYTQNTNISPRDPRVDINEKSKNVIESPILNTVDYEQVTTSTQPSVPKKMSESKKAPQIDSRNLPIPSQNDKRDTTNHTYDKSHVAIDSKTAEKLQRVLRQHISEVKKHTNPNKSNWLAATDVLNEKKIFSSNSSDLEKEVLEEKDETCKEAANIMIQENENYNLHLLASQTVEECQSQKSDTKKRIKLSTADTENSMDKTLPSNSSTLEGQTCISDQFDNDSQDTVIGGLELSPPRAELLMENSNLTLSESYRKSLITNNKSESSESNISKKTTETTNPSLPLITIFNCEGESPENFTGVSNEQHSSLGEDEEDRNESCSGKDHHTNFSSSVTNYTSLSSGALNETVSSEIVGQIESDKSIHQYLWKYPKSEHTFCREKPSLKDNDSDHEMHSNNANKIVDLILSEDTTLNQECIDKKNEGIAHCKTDMKGKGNFKENAVTNSDQSNEKDASKIIYNDSIIDKPMIIEGKTSVVNEITKGILNETTDKNMVKDISEHKVMSDNEEDEGPPDLTKGCCSNIFGNIHHVGENDFACGQSPRAYKSAIIDTLQELSFVLKLLNESSLDGSLSQCLLPKENDNSIKIGIAKHDKKEILDTELDSSSELLKHVEDKRPDSMNSNPIKIDEVKSVEQISIQDVKREPGENNCKCSIVISDELDLNRVHTEHSVTLPISAIKIENLASSDIIKESATDESKQIIDHHAPTCNETVNGKKFHFDKNKNCEGEKESNENDSKERNVMETELQELSDDPKEESLHRPNHLATISRLDESNPKGTSCGQNKVLESGTDTVIKNEIPYSTEPAKEQESCLFSTSNHLKKNERTNENFARNCGVVRDVNKKTLVTELQPISECDGLGKGLAKVRLACVIPPEDNSNDAALSSEIKQTSELKYSTSKSDKGKTPPSSPLQKGLRNTARLTKCDDKTDDYLNNEGQSNYSSEVNTNPDSNQPSVLPRICQSAEISPVAEICKSAEMLKTLLEDFSNNDIYMANTSESYNIALKRQISLSTASTQSCSANENMVVAHSIISESKNVIKTKNNPVENEPSDSKCNHGTETSMLSEIERSVGDDIVNEGKLKNNKHVLNIDPDPNISYSSERKHYSGMNKSSEQSDINLNKAADFYQSPEKSKQEKRSKSSSSYQSELNSVNIEKSVESNKISSLQNAENNPISNTRRKIDSVPEKVSDLFEIKHFKSVKRSEVASSVNKKRQTEISGAFLCKGKVPDTIHNGSVCIKDPLSLGDTAKTNHSSNETKTNLRLNTEVASEIKDKAGILNRRMKERKNMFDTRLNIQKMRAKLTNPLITNVTVDEAETTLQKKNDNPCLPRDSDTQRIKPATISQDTAFLEESKMASTDFEDDSHPLKYIGTEPLSSDTSKDSQSYEHDSSASKMCNENEIRNAKHNGLKEQKHAPGTLQYDQDIEKCTKKSRETDFIPFHAVMRKKKEQYLKYKHGLARNKFIDYSEFREELRGNKDAPNEQNSNQNESFKRLWKSFNYFDNQRGQEDLVPTQLRVHSQGNKEPIISERGTKLYEDRHERETHEDDNNSVRSHTKFIEDDIPFERHELNERSDNTCKRKQRGEVDGKTSNGSNSPITYRHYKLLSNKIPLIFQHNTGPFYSARSLRSFGFNHGQSGYFSWRRKYKNGMRGIRNERIYITRKGVVQTEEEHQEWKMFKERERIRVQIEEAVKDYRRTFENSSDDVVGDEKVSKYLQSLTNKLDHIQSKRKLLNMQEEQTGPNVKERDEETTTSIKLKDEQVEVRRLVSIDNIRDQFETSLKSSIQSNKDASLVDELWREHEGKPNQSELLETMLKEHLLKHLDDVTEKLKLELFAKLQNEHLDFDKTKKRQSYKTNQIQQTVSEIVEKKLDSLRNPQNQTGVEKQSNKQSNYTVQCVHNVNTENDDLYKPGRHLYNRHSALEEYNNGKLNSPTLSRRNSSAENRSNHSNSKERIYRFDLQNTNKRKRSHSGSRERSRSRSCSPRQRKAGKKYYRRYYDQNKYCTHSSKRSRSRSRSRSRNCGRSRRQTLSPEYQSSDQNSGSYDKRSNSSKSRSHSRTRSRSHSLEKQDRKKARRSFENDVDRFITNDRRNNEDILGKTGSQELNKLSKDQFNRYIKEAVRSKWDNPTDNEACIDVKIKHNFMFKNQNVAKPREDIAKIESRKVGKLNCSANNPDEKLKAQKDDDLSKRQIKSAFRHEYRTDSDASDEGNKYDDRTNENATWKKYDTTTNFFEYKNNFKTSDKWGHFRGRNYFASGRGNYNGRFRGNGNFFKSSWHNYDKRHREEKWGYKESDRFNDSYDAERSGRVYKTQNYNWNANNVQSNYQDEYQNDASRHRNGHYRDRYNHTQYPSDDLRSDETMSYGEERYVHNEPMHDSEKVNARREQMDRDYLPLGACFQSSYRKESNSEERSRSPRPIPTICRR